MTRQGGVERQIAARRLRGVDEPSVEHGAARRRRPGALLKASTADKTTAANDSTIENARCSIGR